MIDTINNISSIWWNWMSAMFWQVGLLIIIVACIDLFIKRWAWPQLRYALWILVLVKLVLPPGISMQGSLAERTKPYLNRLISNNVKEPSTIENHSPFIISPESVVALRQMTNLEPQVTFTQQNLQPDVPASVAAAPEIPNVRLSWQSYAMSVWLIGIVVLGFSLILRLRNLRAEQSRNMSGLVLPQSFHLAIQQCARQLKLRHIPDVVVTKKVVCPAVFGIFRPVLLIPKDCLKKMSRKDTGHVLLHELAHIKRGDPIVNCIYLILQIAYWFNPLLWLVRRQLIHLRELCCDATVARVLKLKTNEYRQTLIDIAQQFLTKSVEHGMGLLGLFEDANRLLIRLKWLEKKTWRYQKMKNLTTITIITLMLTFVLPMAKAQEQTSFEEQTTHSHQTENIVSHPENKEVFQTESSKQIQMLKTQLEKLEIEKHNLRNKLEKIEILSQQIKDINKSDEKSAELQNTLQQVMQWQNSDEYKQWQQQMKQWEFQMQQWSQQLKHSITMHNTTGEAHVLPMNAYSSVQTPPMPKSPHFTPEVFSPVNVPTVIVPQIDIPTTGVRVNSATNAKTNVPSTGYFEEPHIIISENDDTNLKAVREMELIPKIKDGALFVIQNNVGNIILSPSQDGKCEVKAIISATAETAEEAQKIAKQIGTHNTSSNERYFLKIIKMTDDNYWSNINVDLYITVPSNIPLDISTNVGSIEITDLNGQIKALTNVGNIKVININGEIELTTKVGSIEFTAPENLSASVKAQTQKGSIQSDFPLDINILNTIAGTAKGIIGSGKNNIILTTEVGKISIKKQSASDTNHR